MRPVVASSSTTPPSFTFRRSPSGVYCRRRMTCTRWPCLDVRAARGRGAEECTETQRARKLVELEPLGTRYLYRAADMNSDSVYPAAGCTPVLSRARRPVAVPSRPPLRLPCPADPPVAA
eukprot:scaffold1637_cov410-Prasinococcus_capsulatus_cf.AAC.4